MYKIPLQMQEFFYLNEKLIDERLLSSYDYDSNEIIYISLPSEPIKKNPVKEDIPVLDPPTTNRRVSRKGKQSIGSSNETLSLPIVPSFKVEPPPPQSFPPVSSIDHPKEIQSKVTPQDEISSFIYF